MMHQYGLKALAERYDLPGVATIEKTLEKLPAISADGPWLAGGSLRRVMLGEEPTSDWDFFFRDEAQAKAFEAGLITRGAKMTSGNDQATTYSLNIENKRIAIVQAVKIGFYPNIAAVLDSFDFSICQLGWDGAFLHVGEFTLFDLARKRLAVHRITYAVASVRRMLKYQTQGYTVCAGAIKALLESVAADPNLIQSEVTYVD